jgi:hypothetical protein
LALVRSAVVSIFASLEIRKDSMSALLETRKASMSALVETRSDSLTPRTAAKRNRLKQHDFEAE